MYSGKIAVPPGGGGIVKYYNLFLYIDNANGGHDNNSAFGKRRAYKGA
jgi:hypothetical protein